MPPGPRFIVPALVVYPTSRLLVPRAPMRFLVEPTSDRRPRLFILWQDRECMLAIENRRTGETETRIALPCAGEALTAERWIGFWATHLMTLLLTAAEFRCPHCRARPGEWCQTSGHGVPGLHRARNGAQPAEPPG